MSQKIVQNTQSDKCRCLDTMMFCSWFLEIRAYANRQHAISHRFEQTYAITITTTDKPSLLFPFSSCYNRLYIGCLRQYWLHWLVR